jgi:hypothetical protein
MLYLGLTLRRAAATSGNGGAEPEALTIGSSLLIALGILSLVVVLLAGIEALLGRAPGTAGEMIEMLLTLGGVVAVHLAFAHRRPPLSMEVNEPWNLRFPGAVPYHRR